MAKTGRFLHVNENNTSVAAVATAYNLAKIHTIDTGYRAFNSNTAQYRGYLEQITMQVEAIAGGAAKLTFKMCSDAGGDICIIPSTEITIEIGTSTATVGTCIAKIDVPALSLNASDIFLFVKVDAGTVTLSRSILCWSE